ncbi:hypothetical protein [Nocardia australiensis]|uniref:hypothetical protein n=1 Tax=Nocardia australiensis TaxID=2887191 RepID=UPI001D151C0E|nr:hypothetical protein [Nocardia australiensis]
MDMDIHAYPTAASTPVNLTEAERIADQYLPTADDAEPGITNLLTEFDSGFTVVAIFLPPPGTDPHTPLPPPTVGGSVYVIDKATGAVSFWPSYPTDLVAELYAEALRTDGLIIDPDWPEED